MQIEQKLSLQLKKIIISLIGAVPENFEAHLDVPKDTARGDLTANAAMRLAKLLKKDPYSIACGIKAGLEDFLGKNALSGSFEKIEIVKPGFINFFFSNEYLHHKLSYIVKQNENYGSNKDGGSAKVQIEFVSANPTGPLTIAHGRQAAIGDALSRILKFSGYKVYTEYFVNDFGAQINALGKSILFHYLSFYDIAIDFPEDGYRGEYIRDIALQIKNRFGNKFAENYAKNEKFFSDFGVEYILNLIKKDLKDFDVHFDTWFAQSSITDKAIRDTLELLRKKEYVYQKDGATWFRSTSFGDEKDRVVIKSDGAFTYFAPDIAYHDNKYRRGFKRIINIWGPDHHGYVPRIKAACKALGHNEESVSCLLVQLATLYRGKEVLSMSTRKGEFVTLREVMDEVGKDVTRFFFLMRKLDSHLDFDLEVAKEKSQDNPVYYIQYAHARIWSIKKFGEEKKKELDKVKLDPALLKEKEEVALMRLLHQFPRYVQSSSKNLEPYFVIVYLNELAKVFHNFYTKHKVIGENLSLTKARVFLIDCVRICLANGLNLLGVSLPKRM